MEQGYVIPNRRFFFPLFLFHETTISNLGAPNLWLCRIIVRRRQWPIPFCCHWWWLLGAEERARAQRGTVSSSMGTKGKDIIILSWWGFFFFPVKMVYGAVEIKWDVFVAFFHWRAVIWKKIDRPAGSFSLNLNVKINAYKNQST